jgi:heme-degrading monooxygenase HmoA
MFLALWEFDVKPGCDERFESVYGPGGEWAQLFQSDPAYQRTLLLRDPFRERTYVTCDFWESREAYEAFEQNNRDAYHALDKSCEELTIAERKIGAFERFADGEGSPAPLS